MIGTVTKTFPPARELSARLADSVDGVVKSLLSKATQSGNYWHVGNVEGEAGKSLYVIRSGDRAGKWKDTATGEHDKARSSM